MFFSIHWPGSDPDHVTQITQANKLLSGHLLGNSCPLGWPFVLICLMSICFFYLVPMLVLRAGFGF